MYGGDCDHLPYGCVSHTWSPSGRPGAEFLESQARPHLPKCTILSPPGKRPWCCEILKAKGEEGGRSWDGWMVSLTQWTWVCANSGRWWRPGKPGVLQFMGSQSQTQLSGWTTPPLLHVSFPCPPGKLLLSIPESHPPTPTPAACVISGHLWSPPDHELLGASPDTSRPGTDLCSVFVNEQIQSNMTDSQEALELEGGDGALVLLLNYSWFQASSFIYSSLGFLIFIKGAVCGKERWKKALSKLSCKQGWRWLQGRPC